MPRAKSYKGVPVKNKRYSNKTMHKVAEYKKYGTKYGVYSDAFDIFVKELANRIRDHQQNVVVVEGDTGSGKSTLCIQLCVALAKELKVDFSLDRDYIYSLGDLWAKISGDDSHPISFFDEGSVSLASQNVNNKEDKDMVTLFNTMRSRGWTTFICIPSITDLNTKVRRVHTDYKVRCSSPNKSLIKGYGRGFFEVSQAKREEYAKSSDPYWYLVYTGIFGSLTGDINREYQKIKMDHQNQLIDDMIKRHIKEESEESGLADEIERERKEAERLQNASDSYRSESC